MRPTAKKRAEYFYFFTLRTSCHKETASATSGKTIMNNARTPTFRSSAHPAQVAIASRAISCVARPA